MPIPAGKLDRRVRFERQSAAEGSYEGEDVAWEPLTIVSAWVQYGRGSERREAAQTAAPLAATFRVRRSSKTADLSPKDRLRFVAGDPAANLTAAPIWNIVSVVPVDRDGMDVAAVLAGAGQD